jgi:hypothetical protein
LFIRSFHPQLTVGCRHVLFIGRRKRGNTLCTQARECAGVGDVGARLSTTAASTTTALATSSSLTTTAASTELATTFTATTSFATAEVAATAASLTATELTTATAASSAATLTGRRSEHTVTIELDVDLLLAGALALGLAT